MALTTVYVSFIKDENGNETKFPNGLMTLTSEPEKYYQLEITNYGDVFFILGKTYLKDNNNGTFTLVTPEDEIKKIEDENYKETLRSRRVYLLNAFDKWEKAVMRGREEDDVLVMQWYAKILDLDSESIENEEIYPDRVKYYM